jgi:hypothetical protein
VGGVDVGGIGAPTPQAGGLVGHPLGNTASHRGP